MARNSVLLLHEYLDEMEDLTDEEFGRLCRFLIVYGKTGEITELTGNERFFAKRVMNTEDRFREKYEAECEKHRNAGRLGGLAKASRARQRQDMLTYSAYPEPEPEPEPDPEPEPKPEPVIKKREKAKFKAPNVEEVAAYCAERSNGIDAQAFCDYYAQQGWKLANGNHLKDWKAAVRTWEKREPFRGRKQPVCSCKAELSREENDAALRQMEAMMREMEGERPYV